MGRQRPRTPGHRGLAGISYTATKAGQGPGRCRMTVERRDPELGGAEVGW